MYRKRTYDRKIAPCIYTPHMPEQLNAIHVRHHHILHRDMRLSQQPSQETYMHSHRRSRRVIWRSSGGLGLL